MSGNTMELRGLCIHNKPLREDCPQCVKLSEQYRGEREEQDEAPFCSSCQGVGCERCDIE